MGVAGVPWPQTMCSAMAEHPVPVGGPPSGLRRQIGCRHAKSSSGVLPCWRALIHEAYQSQQLCLGGSFRKDHEARRFRAEALLESPYPRVSRLLERLTSRSSDARRLLLQFLCRVRRFAIGPSFFVSVTFSDPRPMTATEIELAPRIDSEPLLPGCLSSRTRRAQAQVNENRQLSSDDGIEIRRCADVLSVSCVRRFGKGRRVQ